MRYYTVAGTPFLTLDKALEYAVNEFKYFTPTINTRRTYNVFKIIKILTRK